MKEICENSVLMNSFFLLTFHDLKHGKNFFTFLPKAIFDLVSLSSTNLHHPTMHLYKSLPVLLLLSIKSPSIRAFLHSLLFYRYERLVSIHSQLYDETSSEGNEILPSTLQGFNPWNHGTRTGTSPDGSLQRENGVFRNINNVVSLRQNRMQQLMSELLNAAPNENLMRSILQENKEFLLEPLEDKDAVQDVDSIYLQCKNRQERFRAYERAMEQRLAKATNPTAQLVLTAMKEFVLECENCD
jgi:hypothetical protein